MKQSAPNQYYKMITTGESPFCTVTFRVDENDTEILTPMYRESEPSELHIETTTTSPPCGGRIDAIRLCSPMRVVVVAFWSMSNSVARQKSSQEAGTGRSIQSWDDVVALVLSLEHTPGVLLLLERRERRGGDLDIPFLLPR